MDRRSKPECQNICLQTKMYRSKKCCVFRNVCKCLSVHFKLFNLETDGLPNRTHPKEQRRKGRDAATHVTLKSNVMFSLSCLMQRLNQMTKPIICNSREEILTTQLTAVIKLKESPKSLEPQDITGSHTGRLAAVPCYLSPYVKNFPCRAKIWQYLPVCKVALYLKHQMLYI